VWCLTPDRLSRSYAYQVLISDELARHGVSIRYLDAPDITSDPQARLLTQIQSVIAEYERAKISERSRRGKLYRARAGEAVHWRAPFGYTRVPRRVDQPAHLIINPTQAAVVRRIFADYTTGGLSLRQITLTLNREGVPTATGKRWITSSLGRILRREAYVGRAYVNTTKMVCDRGPGRPPRQIRRPPQEWIPISCPPIIDQATFDAAARVCAQNTNFSVRRLNPNEEAWLLRGLVFCACGTRSIVDRAPLANPEGSTTTPAATAWASPDPTAPAAKATYEPTPSTLSSTKNSAPRWPHRRYSWLANKHSPTANPPPMTSC
jgi:site-specific DNA recombinase